MVYMDRSMDGCVDEVHDDFGAEGVAVEVFEKEGAGAGEGREQRHTPAATRGMEMERAREWWVE